MLEVTPGKITLAAALTAMRARRPQVFDLKTYCFKEQLAFIEDLAKFKTAVCSRRAGKTVGCAADLTDTALKHPGVVTLYITLSRKNAKRLIWPEMLKINREYNLGGLKNEVDLSITYPNGSVFYATGAGDKSEIENFRGLAIKKAYVDEAQAFRQYIRDLIDDVLSKSLFDYDGTLCLTGTPGMIPAGYFHECAHSVAWSHHAWTMFQNPWLERKSGKSAQVLVSADCERMGVGIEHPKIQRECFGRWIMDPDSLVFKYDKARNHYARIPEVDGEWEYVIGVDLGYDDSDAIAVIGWHKKLKEAYLVEEFVRSKQGVTELATELDRLYKAYAPMKIVMDTGGLGKKITEEIKTRYAIPIEAAEKSQKFAFIEIFNDALRTGKFFAQAHSRFAQDCFLVEWDKESVNPKLSDNYHSDITDAVLYAFRESLHWLHTPEVKAPERGTSEWAKRIEDQMEREAEEAIRGKNDDVFGQGDVWRDYED